MTITTSILQSVVFVLVALSLFRSSFAESYRVYVGTNTGGDSKGIYTLMFDAATGALTSPELAAEVRNPSFIAIHPSGQTLFSISEVSDFQNKRVGGVSAFRIGHDNGRLQLLNEQESGGTGPCHISVDQQGTTVLVANYGSGSCASLPVNADGTLRAAVSTHQHSGVSVHPQRQKGPHAHSINLDLQQRFAFVADLGIDQIKVYQFDKTTSSLAPHNPASVSLVSGAGPRHFAFHPSGKIAYAINELNNTVTTFRYSPDEGVLTPVNSVPTLPADFKGTSFTAEVVVHPNGNFLYGSNRGHDSLALFTIDKETGLLTAKGHFALGGKTPRNFCIDPTGNWIVAGCQGSHSLVVFQIHQETGELKPVGDSLKLTSPVCIRFLSPGK